MTTPNRPSGLPDLSATASGGRPLYHLAAFGLSDGAPEQLIASATHFNALVGLTLQRPQYAPNIVGHRGLTHHAETLSDRSGRSESVREHLRQDKLVKRHAAFQTLALTVVIG